MKICKKCLVEKDLTEFRRQYKSGYEHVCMSCNANKVKHTNVDGILGKVCRKCTIWQSLDCYHKDKTKSDGLHSYCKICQKDKSKQFYIEDLTRQKELRKINYEENSTPYKKRARERETKLSLEPGFSQKQWLELCAKYDNKCLCCKQVKKLTIDHIIPLSKGGKHEIENVQPLCIECNKRKFVEIIDYRV